MTEKYQLKLKQKSVLGKSVKIGKRIFASTSTTIFSVIYCARQLLFTIFIKFKQKSFRIWFQIGSYIFGRGKKMHLKKQLLEFVFINKVAISQLFGL